MKRAGSKRVWRLAVLGTTGLTCALVAGSAAAQRGQHGAPHAPVFRPVQPAYRPQPRNYPPQERPMAPPAYRYGGAPGYGYPSRSPQGYYGQQQNAAPVERRPPQPGASVSAAPPLQPGRGNAFTGSSARGEHLAEWMNLHSNLTPQQQQEALGREPGFRDLPGPTQQRIRDRLSELDAMAPQQRQRMMAHTETMERLNPAQRAEVRGAMLQLGSLPREQQRAVSQAFRDLRSMPPDQREAAMNMRFGGMNPQQRYTLQRLMQVEPMLPPPER